MRKLEPCNSRLLAVTEKQYGADSTVLLSTLASEAQALRRLGRAEEAVKVEKHLQAIQAKAGQGLTEGAALPPQR
jgi:hypothetical protein